jgi:hypothetical protein
MGEREAIDHCVRPDARPQFCQRCREMVQVGTVGGWVKSTS